MESGQCSELLLSEEAAPPQLLRGPVRKKMSRGSEGGLHASCVEKTSLKKPADVHGGERPTCKQEVLRKGLSGF